MEFETYLERDIAYVFWNRSFDDWEVRKYWGVASLFGEKEQSMYPSEFSYKVWKNNFRNVLLEAVGLDKFCVDYLVDVYFNSYFDFE